MCRNPPNWVTTDRPSVGVGTRSLYFSGCSNMLTSSHLGSSTTIQTNLSSRIEYDLPDDPLITSNTTIPTTLSSLVSSTTFQTTLSSLGSSTTFQTTPLPFCLSHPRRAGPPFPKHLSLVGCHFSRMFPFMTQELRLLVVRMLEVARRWVLQRLAGHDVISSQEP